MYNIFYDSEVKERRLKSHKLREELSGTLERLGPGEAVVIERYARPTAALISISDYWRLTGQDAQLRRHKENSMPTQRLVVANISGGEGKSTIARELAYCLQQLGFKVALFDLDPQASLSKFFGLHAGEGLGLKDGVTVAGVFDTEEAGLLPPPTANCYGVDIWAANERLGQLDNVISADIARVDHLRVALDHYLAQMDEPYDFVILDTKPQRSNFLIASIAAADSLLVPSGSLKGLENLDQLNKVVLTARRSSPGLAVKAFVPNRLRINLKHHQLVLETLRDTFGHLAPLTHVIRDSAATMGAATEFEAPAVLCRPNEDVSQDLRLMTQDVLRILGVKVPA